MVESTILGLMVFGHVSRLCMQAMPNPALQGDEKNPFATRQPTPILMQHHAHACAFVSELMNTTCPLALSPPLQDGVVGKATKKMEEAV